jgi:cytidine deaminase
MGKFDYQIKTDKKVYDIPDDICKKMFQQADEAMKHCFPVPNEGFAITVLTDQGNIYEGVSYKSDTETLTMHSEATALAHAAIHGETNIIAITGWNCHICKQLIWESSLRSGIDVMIVWEEDNRIFKKPISSMMPYPWPEKLEKPSKENSI